MNWPAYNQEQPVAVGDWIRISWMDGAPTVEVIGIDDFGYPVVEHPRTPGIGPMTVDVYDWVCSGADSRHFMGAGI